MCSDWDTSLHRSADPKHAMSHNIRIKKRSNIMSVFSAATGVSSGTKVYHARNPCMDANRNTACTCGKGHTGLDYFGTQREDNPWTFWTQVVGMQRAHAWTILVRNVRAPCTRTRLDPLARDDGERQALQLHLRRPNGDVRMYARL
jgi:hypothetical protein